MKLEKRTLSIDYAKGRPGAYVLARDLVVDGHPYGLSLECANPAYGDRVAIRNLACNSTLDKLSR